MGRVSLDSPVPASWPAALPQPAHSKRHAGSPEMTGQPHQTDWAAADPVRAPGPAAAASPAGMRHTLALMLVLLTVALAAAMVWLLSGMRDRKSTRLNSSHLVISYAVFCLKKKKRDSNS